MADTSNIVQEFDLNMVPDSAPIVIKCDQYDKGPGRLQMHLFYGNNRYIPASGTTALIQGTKPDGKGFSYTATIGANNLVQSDLHEQMTAVPGRVRVNLIIQNATNIRTGSFVFWLDVQPTGLADDVDTSTSELAPYLNGAQQAAEDAAQSASAALQSATAAGQSANAAAQSARDAAASATSIEGDVTMAQQAAQNASGYAGTASTKAGEASTSAQNANRDAGAAAQSALSAQSDADRAKAWAVGPNGTGTGTDTNNAKYYAEIAESVTGLIVDTYPTQGSGHVVTSGGVYEYIQDSISGILSTSY